MRNPSRSIILSVVLFAGCSGGGAARNYVWEGLDEASAQRVTVRQRPMDAGETFTAVYRSPQIGDMELMQTGSAVVGRYEYDRGSCHVMATLQGSAEGNLFKFEWREDHRVCGRLQPVTGHGFFLHQIEEGSLHRGRLFGRWGYGEDDHGGGNWLAFQVIGRQPTMLQESAAGAAGGTDATGSSGGPTDGVATPPAN